MSVQVIRAAVRSVQGSADFLNEKAKALARAEKPQQIVVLALDLEVEIERLRTLVLLLLHDAKRDIAVDLSPKAVGVAL